MSLKLRSTVAVVTGKTTASLAKDARFGKPATKALLAKRVVTIVTGSGKRDIRAYFQNRVIGTAGLSKLIAIKCTTRFVVKVTC